jgi:hypothetical protein
MALMQDAISMPYFDLTLHKESCIIFAIHITFGGIMEIVNYKGWKNSVKLSNGIVDLIVTTDVGPRVIFLGFSGQSNELYENPDTLGKVGGDSWNIYGGHRFWHAPEVKPRTYFPDNHSVKYESHENWTKFIQNTESLTGIQKEIHFKLNPVLAQVTVVHRLINHNVWAVDLAPWALTVMAAGGKGIIPLPTRGLHTEKLLPANTMTFWAYTNMADPRWTWGAEYVVLNQDPSAKIPQKMGAYVPDGWVAYARNDHLLVKKVDYQPGQIYPDLGCNVEMFTDQNFLEIETLGPMTHLEPGKSLDHIEGWFLYDHVPTPLTEHDIVDRIKPKI